MFEIEIDRSFSAAHQLRGYNGDCCKLHGHNYKITVTVRSS
ncbi:6-carboxytetrahydropterin synthase, partial [uncultured Victivallis sp.]